MSNQQVIDAVLDNQHIDAACSDNVRTLMLYGTKIVRTSDTIVFASVRTGEHFALRAVVGPTGVPEIIQPTLTPEEGVQCGIISQEMLDAAKFEALPPGEVGKARRNACKLVSRVGADAARTILAEAIAASERSC